MKILSHDHCILWLLFENAHNFQFNVVAKSAEDTARSKTYRTVELKSKNRKKTARLRAVKSKKKLNTRKYNLQKKTLALHCGREKKRKFRYHVIIVGNTGLTGDARMIH
jgi:hypothetical protein